MTGHDVPGEVWKALDEPSEFGINGYSRFVTWQLHGKARGKESMAVAGRMELCRKTLGRIRDELVLANRAANFQPWGLVVVYQSYRAPKASLNTIATLKKGVLSQRHNLSAGILSKPLDSSESITAWRSTGGNYHLFIRYPQPAIDEGNTPFTPNFAIKNTWQKFIQSFCEPLEDCANSLELPSLEIIPEDRLESNSWISWLFALGAMDDPIPGHRIDPKFIWYSGGQPVLGGSADHVLNQVNMAVEIPLDLSKWRAEVELAEWDQERQIAVIPNRKDHSGEPYQVPMSWFSHIEDVHRASIACIDWMLTQIQDAPQRELSPRTNLILQTKNSAIPETTVTALRRAQDELQLLFDEGFNPEVICLHAHKLLYDFIHFYDIDIPLKLAPRKIESANRQGGWPPSLFIPPVGKPIPEDYEFKFSSRCGVYLKPEFYRRYESCFVGWESRWGQRGFERIYVEFYPDQNHEVFEKKWTSIRRNLTKTLDRIDLERWPHLWKGIPSETLQRPRFLEGWFDLVFQLAHLSVSGCPVKLDYHMPLDERFRRITDWNPTERPFAWVDPEPFAGWEFNIDGFASASIHAIDWLIANWPDEASGETSGGGDVTVKTFRLKPKASSSKGDAERKLVAALSMHHQYENGSCLEFQPIPNNELKRIADVGKASASRFLKKHFGSHSCYVIACRKRNAINTALMAMNGDLRPAKMKTNQEGEGYANTEDNRKAHQHRKKPLPSNE